MSDLPHCGTVGHPGFTVGRNGLAFLVEGKPHALDSQIVSNDTAIRRRRLDGVADCNDFTFFRHHNVGGGIFWDVPIFLRLTCEGGPVALTFYGG